MSGFMRKAALVVGAVALVAATAGAAGAVLAPGLAGSASVAGVSTATLTAIGTYGGLAAGVLSAVATATAPGVSSQGSATTFQTNPQSGLPYAMGRTRMSGLRIFADTNTRPGYTKFNDLLWFGAMLSIGGQIEQIETFTADNEVVTFDASGNANGAYHDYQAQKVHLGGPQASALALTLGGGAAPGWTSQHRLSGITHAMWCLRYNKQGEMYGAGAPEPAWTGKWVKVYDPRLDSTYPGGSGSCRPLVETTYVWSDNPGLHALTWALGRWQNGKRTCGIGAPVSTIRIADFVECANVCEANGWKVGGVEWTTDSKWDTLKRILQAGGARPTKTGAMIGCMVSTPRTAIATIESRHLLDSLSIAATKGRRDRFNSVIPRYVDEDSDWSVVSGTAITVPEYVDADRGQRTKEIDYPLVQVFSGDDATQPGQLAAYDIVNSREAGPIDFTTGPEWVGLKTGDVVLLHVPEEGLVNQPILITRRSPDPSTGKVTFSAQTETLAKHAYALGQSTTPPAPFSLTAPDLKPPAPSAANWSAAGTVTGEGLPAIVVTGTSEMPSADALLIDYRKGGEEDWLRAAILSANEPVQHVIAPLESATAYQVRVGYRVEQIDGDFTILAAVTTGTGIISDLSDTIGGQQDQLAQLEADTAAAESAIAAAQAQIAAIESSVSADFSTVYAEVDALQSDLSTAQSDIGSLQSASSSVQQSVSTLQGDVNTAKSNIASIQGSVGNLNTSVGTLNSNVSALQSQAAGIISDVDGLADAVTALGGDVSTIQSTLSSQGASITSLQITASNTAGDVATLKTQVTAGGGNLLKNTDFPVGYEGWTATGTMLTGVTHGINLAGDAYRPPNENVFSIRQTNGTTTGYQEYTQEVPVAPNEWYSLSVYVAAHRCTCAIYALFIDASGAVVGTEISVTGQGPGGNTLASFTRLSGKRQAPAGAVKARIYIRKFSTLSGQADSYAWFLRPMFAVTTADTAGPPAYAPGSGLSSISLQATALSTLTTAVSSLSTTVSTQGGSITTMQQSITSLQGSVSTLSSTVSTQGSSITTLQQSMTTAQGDLATLKTQVTAGGGNLLTNTDLAIDTSGWSFGNSAPNNGSAGGRNLNGDAYRPGAENVLTIAQDNATTTGYADFMQIAQVEGGKWYDVSVYAASHRSSIAIYVQFLDAAGAVLSTPTAGTFAATGGGNTLASFVRRSFKAQAPAAATGARLILRKFGTNSGANPANSYAWFCRPQIAETLSTSATPLAYSPGSARVVISTQATAISTLDGSLASLTTRVGTAEANISSTASAVTTAQGNIATLQSTVSSQGGSITTLQQSYTTLNGTVNTLSSTVSAQGSQISTLQSTTSTTAGDVATLKTQVRAGGGNLLVNTDLAINTSGWSFSSGNGGVGERVASGDQWIVTGENGLRTSQPNAATSSQSDWTQEVAVEATKWYDVSVYAAAHRANIQVYLQFRDASGGVLATPDSGLIAPVGGGNTLANFIRVSFKGQAPAGAASARLYLRKFGTLSGVDSYAWWLRPQVVETTATSASPVAYSPGSNRATISTQADALSTLNTSFASLSTRVASAEGGITTMQSSLTSANRSISTLQSNVSSLQGSVSTLQSSSTTHAGQISALQSTVSTQGASITTQGQSITSLQGNLSTLTTQVAAGSNPNLCPNGGFENGLSGWTASGGSSGNWFTTANSWGSYATNGTPWAGGSGAYAVLQAATVNGLDAGSPITLTADADIRASAAGATAYMQIAWFSASGTTYTNNVSRAIGTGIGFDPGGSSRDAFKLTTTVPSGTTGMAARLVVSAPSGVTITSMAWRQVKLERGTIATPYSGEATAGQMYQAYATLNTSFASLSTTVSSQGGSISTLQSSYTSLSGTVSSMSSTVSAQGASISTLQNASSTQSGQITALQTQVRAGGGNLVQNSDIPSTAGWLSTGDMLTGVTFSINGQPSDYQVKGLRNFTIYQGNAATSGYQEWRTDDVEGSITVEPGKWYDVSVRYGAHRCNVTIYCQFLNAAGTAIDTPQASGGLVTSGQTIDQWGTVSFKALAPAGAARARLYLRKFGTLSGSDSWAWFARPQIVETTATSASPVAYSPGSARASILSQATAISTLESQQASLSTTVSTQGGSISTLQSSVSSLQGSVSTLQSTVTTQGSSISSLQTAVSTAQGDVATLKTQITAGGGNLLRNTDFPVDTAGWSATGTMTSGVTFGINIAGESYRPPNKHVASILQANGTTTGYQEYTQEVAVLGGEWYYAAAYAAAHRSTCAMYVQFVNAGGSVTGLGIGVAGQGAGGSSISAFSLLSGKAQAPADAVKARIYLRKNSTISGQGDSYAWFLRPMFAVTTANAATPPAYSPGSARASISQQASALSTLTTQYASLSSTVATQGVSISSQATAISTIEGNVSSLFGRAAMTIAAGNVITGWENSTNGSVSSFKIQADIFEVVPSNPSGERTSYSNGAWKGYDSAGQKRFQLGNLAA